MTLQLPENYYHCFMGNGTDAVLIGYTGSMVPHKVSVDRCNWYKSDRYYPEDKLVMVAGRYPLDKKLEHSPGSGWYEVAPIGRTWYFVLDEDGKVLELLASEQKFVPREGTLYTDVDYGAVKGKVVTWLHATRSILIEQYTFDQEVDFQAWMGPGVWVDDIWDTDPFRSIEMSDTAPEGLYDLGETQGIMVLKTEPVASDVSKVGNDRYVTLRGKTFTKFFYISDNRQGLVSTRALDEAMALGIDALRKEHQAFWDHYFAVSSISIPDETMQFFYDASMYHLKAMQSPVSGGLPVNNLRRTWSSHIFWDSYFLHHALLGANHRAEALEGARFFQRTADAARRHARDEFDADGMKWDWEITHDGRKAYGTLLHMKFQVHNNGSYANTLMGYYNMTQDKAYLEEFFPILEGLATFFRKKIVEKTERGYEIGYLVGVHESPVKVRNDGTNLAGTIVILRHYAHAAEILGHANDFSRECLVIADELMKIMDGLFNGTFFKASDDQEHINMSSVAPIYPMQVINPKDERSISTIKTYLGRYEGGLMGDGMHERAFPWSAGVVGSILAWQDEGDLVWEILKGTYPTMCNFGGMTEVMEDGEWNMQYFGTAQAACCVAIHQMLLQTFEEDSLLLFPAIPSSWEHTSYENLLASGFTISADWTPNTVQWTATNIADVPLTRHIVYGDRTETVTLQPGETRQETWVS